MIQTEGKSGEAEGQNNSEAGLLIFQSKPYTKSQLQYIRGQCNGPEDEEKLAKMVFGDKDTNKTRDQGTNPQWFSPQQGVMSEYDKSFTYGITISFNSPTPNIDNYKVLMDTQFDELKNYLSNGGDVVIPKPQQQEINKNKNKYYKDGKQVIWHNIGMDKTALPFDYMAYIQQKIGELRSYAGDTITVEYHGNYKPSTDKSDEKFQSFRTRGRGRGRGRDNRNATRGRGRGRDGARGRERRGRGRDRGRGKGMKNDRSKKEAKFIAIFNHNDKAYKYFVNEDPEEWDDKLFEKMKAIISRHFNIEDTFTISTKDTNLDIDDIDEVKEEFDSLEDGNTINFVLKDVTPRISKKIIIDYNNQQCIFTLYGNSEKWNGQDFEKLKRVISAKWNIEQFTITTKESDDAVNDINYIKDKFDSLQDGDTIHFALKDVTARNPINQRIAGRGRGKERGRGRGNRERGRGRGRGGARPYDSKPSRGRGREFRGRGRGYRVGRVGFDARAGRVGFDARAGGRGSKHRAEKVNGQHQGFHPCLAQSGGCKFGPNCRFAKISANACLTYLNHQIKPSSNPPCNFGNQCRFEHVDLYNNNNANFGTNNNNRSRQTRKAPPKFQANKTNSTPRKPTPNKKLHPCVVQKGSCMFGDNCKFAQIIGNACLQDLQHQVDSSKPKCRFGWNCRNKHIKFYPSRATRQTPGGTPGGYRSTPRGTPGGTPGHKSSSQKGQLMFQSEWYTKEQLQHIQNGCNSREDMKKLGKMLFGDNDVDKTRGTGVERQHNGGQANVMGDYDRSFAFGITTAFYRGDKGVPEISLFRLLMDSQFAELQHHLLNGYDVVVPKPTQQDIDKNKNRYYKDGLQVIFHNIGTGIASLPFEYIEYIQQKIDELGANYASRTKTITYYRYHGKQKKKDDMNLKELIRQMQEEKSDKMKEEFEQKWEEKQREFDELSQANSDAQRNLRQQLQQEYKDELNKMEQKHQQDIEQKEQELKEIEQHFEDIKKQMGGSIVWKWQENDGTWHPYDDTNSASMEQLKIGQSHQFTFSGNSQTYKITKLTSSTAQQENVNTNVKRDVKQTRKAGSNIEYPEWWHSDKLVTDDSDNTDEYGKPRLYELDLNTSPAKDVVAQMKKTCPSYTVVSVESMENQMLYDAYWNARKKLIKLIGENNLNTRRVWHGTGSGGKDVMGIVQRGGFMKVFSSTAAYGKGTYFARDASYSCPSYCCNDDNGDWQVFQCEVMMGESHRGSSSYCLRSWPKKNGGDGLIYDSLVNNTSDPSIFVIHENQRAYPMFVVHYQT